MEKVKNTTTSNAEMDYVSRTEYETLRQEKDELAQKLDYLMGQLRLAKKSLFGTSSEKSDAAVIDQLSLFFNEAEALSVTEGPKDTGGAAHTRKKKVYTLGDVLPDGLPEEVVEHGLSKEERKCAVCGDEMQVIGKEEQLKLKLIPAKAIIVRHIYYTYACMNCKERATETPILKTPREPTVIPGSFASPEAVAHIITQKFTMYSPLYRQEQEWNRAGVMLSRQTMSNWILRATDDWLAPIYDELHRQLLQREVLHADETVLQVLREDGRRAQAQSRMWMYRTSGDAEHPIVLYEYQPTRKAIHAQEFLKGFSGWLHADGYQGYYSLENIRTVSCWAHTRREFDEAVTVLSGKDIAGTEAALQGQMFCTKLFDLEKEFADLTPEERYEQRLKRAQPILDAFWAWANTRTAPPKSKLGEALGYLKNNWAHLIRYLEDGRLELSNNRAERSIKPFVMGRKNFLFCNTPGGAQDSAIMYSITETAKENGLDPFRYLTYIFSTAPKLKENDPDWAKKLTPDQAPESCRSLRKK